MPHWILRIKEKTVSMKIGQECLVDMEGVALDFFKHYHTDRTKLPADLFWTGRGWVQGLKTWDENVRCKQHGAQQTETTPANIAEFHERSRSSDSG